MSLAYLLIASLLFASPLQAVWPFGSEARRPFSIMLDPAGDAKNTGRIIEDSFERGITLQFAEQLKKLLEERYPGVRVVLTRFPGETIEHLQNANFANRLVIDLYVSIHFYLENASKPKPDLYLYHFLSNPITDFWAKPRPLVFYPYDQAHLYALNQTILWGQQIKNVLRGDAFRNLFEVKGVYGIPFRPLIGIKAPALAFEAGIKNKAYWKTYLEPLAQSLGTLMQEAA